VNPTVDNESNIDQNDKFLYCRNVCRLNSRMYVINEHQWKSEMKYCFPVSSSNQNDSKMERETGALVFGLNPKVEDKNQLESNTVKPEENTELVTTTTTRPSIPEYNGLLLKFKQISKVQQEQQDLLSQLEEEIRKLLVQNEILAEENETLKSSQLVLLANEEDSPQTVVICSSLSVRMVFIFLLLGLSINILC